MSDLQISHSHMIPRRPHLLPASHKQRNHRSIPPLAKRGFAALRPPADTDYRGEPLDPPAAVLNAHTIEFS